MLAYLGEEGCLVNVELRLGKQHCQKETPAFLQETICLARLITDETLLVRMDSGNDAFENLSILESEENIDSLIKRNLRREDPLKWGGVGSRRGS